MTSGFTVCRSPFSLSLPLSLVCISPNCRADNSGAIEEGVEDNGEAANNPNRVSGALGLGVYTLLSLGAIVVTVASSYANTLAGQTSSRTFHEALVRGILRAPMAFFDTTPLGRVVNRFSKDISVLDDRLPATLYMWLSTLCSCVVAVAVISFVVSLRALFCFIILFFFFPTFDCCLILSFSPKLAAHSTLQSKLLLELRFF